MSQTMECSHCGLKFNLESASVTTFGKACPRCGWLLKAGEVMERHKESMEMLAKDDGPELKPCPFCGSTDVHLLKCLNIIEPENMVFCMKCGAGMISGWFKEEDERLMEMWNRRVKE